MVWTGYGTESHPQRDDTRVREHFGEAASAELLTAIHTAEDDFYASDARNTAPDLGAMGDQAATEFRTRRPDLSEDAVDALAWCYTFDYK